MNLKIFNGQIFVITVSERLRQIYIDEVGLDADKIITVPNTPSSSVFNQGNVDAEIVKKYDKNFMLFYAGAIDVLRGLDLIVKAIARLKSSYPGDKIRPCRSLCTRM